MADVTISYKGNEIATMSDSGVKTLLTSSAFCEDDITVSYTKPSGGSSVTTVSFGDDAIFAGTYIGYVDGNGTYQTTTQLAMMSATTYQMLSKSILVWADTIDPLISGSISGSFSGLTLVGTKKLTGNRFEADIYIYQVD